MRNDLLWHFLSGCWILYCCWSTSCTRVTVLLSVQAYSNPQPAIVNRRAIAGLWRLTPTINRPLKEFTVYPKKKKVPTEESLSDDLLLMLREDGSFQQFQDDEDDIDEDEDADSDAAAEWETAWASGCVGVSCRGEALATRSGCWQLRALRLERCGGDDVPAFFEALVATVPALRRLALSFVARHAHARSEPTPTTRSGAGASPVVGRDTCSGWDADAGALVLQELHHDLGILGFGAE